MNYTAALSLFPWDECIQRHHEDNERSWPIAHFILKYSIGNIPSNTLQSFSRSTFSNHLQTNSEDWPVKSSRVSVSILAVRRLIRQMNSRSSNSPPLPGGDQIPHPPVDKDRQIPSPRAKQSVKCPGYARGGCWRFDLTGTLQRGTWKIHQLTKFSPTITSSFVTHRWLLMHLSFLHHRTTRQGQLVSQKCCLWYRNLTDRKQLAWMVFQPDFWRNVLIQLLNHFRWFLINQLSSAFSPKSGNVLKLSRSSRKETVLISDSIYHFYCY